MAKYYVKLKFGTKGKRLVNLTPVKACKAQCLECMEYHGKKIRECPHLKCSIRPYRNGMQFKDLDNVAVTMAISEYCRDCSDQFKADIEQCDLCLLKPWRGYVREPEESEVID